MSYIGTNGCRTRYEQRNSQDRLSSGAHLPGRHVHADSGSDLRRAPRGRGAGRSGFGKFGLRCVLRFLHRTDQRA